MCRLSWEEGYHFWCEVAIYDLNGEQHAISICNCMGTVEACDQWGAGQQKKRRSAGPDKHCLFSLSDSLPQPFISRLPTLSTRGKTRRRLHSVVRFVAAD